MEIDSRRPFRLFLADSSSPSGFLPAEELGPLLASSPLEAARCANPARFAAAELAAALGAALGRKVEAGRGDEDGSYGLLMLDAGPAQAAATAGGSGGGRPAAEGFGWRASPDRVELHGEGPFGLLAAVYDFLGAAGFAWVSPGMAGERVPARLELPRASGRRRAADAPIAATMILGHGSYLEAAEDYLLFAARNGYSGVFFHTTTEALAYGAAPLALYERMRPRLLPLLASLGLEVELGGHGLSGLLPRRLFRREPELFRMSGGERRPDRNLCVSSPRALALVAGNFAAFAAAHPEVSVFHCWPDDLPGGGWCSCPACSGLSPAAQSLRAAEALAEALARVRPGARLSFLAYHDTEELAAIAGRSAGDALGDTDGLPPGLELLWAPRKRSWAAGYGDPGSALNAASRARYEAAARWAGAGPAIFEYWEDAILFKGSVPPLSRTMAGDLSYYASLVGPARPASVGILLTGSGLPLAPRPNLWLFPRLLGAAARGEEIEKARREALEAWAGLAYGPAAGPMADYAEALEAAWKIDLDLEEGDTELFMPEPMAKAPLEPPADWGDPWKASPARLAARRARAEELFDRLREAEAALARAQEAASTAADAGAAGGAARGRMAVEAEASSYALASGLLELDSARLSAYEEAARASPEAAADIALIASSILDGLSRSARAMPDRRARRNLRFLLFLNYELRLRAMERYKAGPLRRGLGLAETFLELALRAAAMRGLWE